MEWHLAWHAVLIPSLIAALACGMSRFIPFVSRLTPLLVPLALAAVAVRAGVVQEGRSILSTWPPATRWITALACIAAMGIAGSLLGLAKVRDDDRGTMTAALVAGLVAGGIILGLLAIPGTATAWTIARAAMAAAMLTMILSVGKVRGPGIFLSLAFPAAALAGLLLISGSAKLAVTAGATAFACGLLGLLAIPLRITLGAGGIATMAVASVTLAAAGRAYDYESFPRWLWLVVVAAPLGGAFADLVAVRLLPGFIRFAIRVGPPLVAAGGAVVTAAWHAGAFSTGDAAEPYGP